MKLLKIQNPQLRDLFKTPKRKTYTLAGVTALTVGIFIFLSLRPTFIKIAHLNREIKDKQEFLNQLDDKLEDINYLISQKSSVAQELNYFHEDFPTEEKSGFLVANFAAIADKFSIDLISVEFEEVDSEDLQFDMENIESIGVVQGNVRLEGNLADIESYVDHLESFPRILDVQSIVYSQNVLSEFEGDLEDFMPIQCSISINIFHWTEVGEIEE